MKEDTITYNYWIYIFICLAIAGVMIKIVGRDPGTQWDINDILFRFAKMSFFATLAWFIGKKYSLHYALVCGLSILIMAISRIVWEFSSMLLFHASFSFDYIWLGIWLSFSSTLLVGGAIFIISFPFQFLFFKLKQNFKKLE